MALNPPLNSIGEPFRVQNEIFILQRKGIEFEVKVKGLGKMQGKGKLVLTTSRIVLINSSNLAKSEFKAFDVPLALIVNEKFNQPIFGANYLSGICKPLYNMIPADAEFKIWFMEGGCGKFLKSFRYTIKQIRQNVGQGPSQAFLQEVQSAEFQQQFAYFDPNDPSTIYVSQPPVQQPPQPMPLVQQQQQYIPPQPQQNQYQQPMIPQQQYQQPIHQQYEEAKGNPPQSQQLYPNINQQFQPSPQVIPPQQLQPSPYVLPPQGYNPQVYQPSQPVYSQQQQPTTYQPYQHP